MSSGKLASVSSVDATPSSEPKVNVDVPPSSRKLRALVAAALDRAGIADDDALTDLAQRSRRAALLPEVRLRAMHSVTSGAKLTQTSVSAADGTTISLDGSTDLLEGRLLFRLDRFVFADEEVALERLRVERTELRERLVTRVVELFVRWNRARRAANDERASELEREEAALSAAECVLALDALTDGRATRLLASPR
jgi:hypothetical protein